MGDQNRPTDPFLASIQPPAPGIGETLLTGLGYSGGIPGGIARAFAEQQAIARGGDPLSQQLRLAQAIQQAGTAPTPYGPVTMAPDQGGFPQAPMMGAPVPPSTPIAPSQFSLSNLPFPQQMIAQAAFPSLDPNKIATQKYLEQETIAKQLANQDIQGRPTQEAAAANAATIIPTLPEGTRMTQPVRGGGQLEFIPPSQAEKDKKKYDALNEQFAAAISDRIAKTGEPFPQAADAIYNAQSGTYGILPTSYPGVAAAHEYRSNVFAESKADARNRVQIAEQQRQFAQQERMLAIREGAEIQPGVFGNSQTGEVGQVTKAEYRAAPKGLLRRVSSQEQGLHDRLQSALPMLDRLDEIVPRVLARYPGQQLPTLIKNYAAHKMGTDPDLQDLMQLGTGLAAEQAAALTGSSRILGGLYQAVRGESVPGITVTLPVAQRMLQTGRTEINNRLNTITGRPLEQYGQVPQSQTSPPRTPGTPSPDEVEAAKKRLGVP